MQLHWTPRRIEQRDFLIAKGPRKLDLNYEFPQDVIVQVHKRKRHWKQNSQYKAIFCPLFVMAVLWSILVGLTGAKPLWDLTTKYSKLFELRHEIGQFVSQNNHHLHKHQIIVGLLNLHKWPTYMNTWIKSILKYKEKIKLYWRVLTS